MTWSGVETLSSPEDVQRAFLSSREADPAALSLLLSCAGFLRLSRLGAAPDAHSHISGAIQATRPRGSGQSTLLAQLGMCCLNSRYYNVAFPRYFSTTPLARPADTVRWLEGTDAQVGWPREGEYYA